jgi:hypothetical protein
MLHAHRSQPDSPCGRAARDGHDLVALMFREISDLLLRRPPLATLLVSAIIPVLCAKKRILLYRIGPSQSKLFIANADGSDERPLLPNAGFDYNASFSTDGKWIIFASERGGPATSTVCIRMGQVSSG